MKNLISQLRAEKGWSQADLAQRLSVSRQTVNALELSKTDPSLSLALRVAWFFDKPVESIFLPDLEEKMSFLQANWQYQDRTFVTAFDEVGILDQMGVEGWEMIGFGAGVLRFRRPEDAALRQRWHYQRINGVLTSRNRTSQEADAWLYCGSWMGVFHYFKRCDYDAAQAPAEQTVSL
jgi:DNA-binding XRE family transcriptional regulator